ncbi:MAG: hypothetical protein K6U74_12850 [Firmicutes bacterium]|nr:hypothetical protein [Bacillota bacterium]
MESFGVLKATCEIGAVHSDESRMTALIRDIFSEFGHEIMCDKMGNIIIRIAKGSKKRLLIFTHYDEPGLVIRGADEGGCLDFETVGPIDPGNLAAQEVLIYGKKTMEGVIGLRPPHILSPEERKAPVEMSELKIDAGLSRFEALNMVPPGTTAVVKRQFMRLQKNMVMARALGDRASIAVLHMFLKDMEKINAHIDADIYIVMGTQHYGGYKGAICVSERIKPDAAIVIDSTDAESRELKGAFAKCGMGPAIYRGPIAHPRLTLLMIQFSKRSRIHHQVIATAERRNTDAWAVQISCGGIPTALMMIPVRYRRSAAEMMDFSDVECAAGLLGCYAKSLGDMDWGDFLCW